MTATAQRILVVDDQETIHEDYRKILAPRPSHSASLELAAAALFDDELPEDPTESFDLESAYQGQEGFERVQQALREGRPFSMAFVDIRMPPGWDGIETVQRIWKVDPEILVVLCSAYSDYSLKQITDKLGRTDRFLMLRKPFDNIEVRQCAMALTERWRLARMDALTGVLSRRACLEHFEWEWDSSVEQGAPLSCLMLDLDYFKRINDSLGHSIGDRVLQTAATRLMAACRPGDYVCRYGGEEFCVILPRTTEEEARILGEQARRLLGDTPIEVDQRGISLTGSIGVAERLDDVYCFEELIDRADQALRVAKQTGRNRTVAFTHLDPGHAGAHPADEAKNLFGKTTAGEVMVPIKSLGHQCSIETAANFLVDSGITSVPVIDQAGKLAGIVSEKDLFQFMQVRDAWGWPLADVMQRNVVSYATNSPIQPIVDFLGRVMIGQVVVVQDGQPVGVINRRALLDQLRSQR